MMKYHKRYCVVLFLLFICICNGIAAKKQKVISGTVTDKISGEVLIGATILDKLTGNATVTDGHGHYSLWISSDCDSTELEISYVGYLKQIIKPICQENYFDWKLEMASYNLNEVVVSSNNRKAIDPIVSSFKMNKQELDVLPGIAGEKDLLKYLQLIPGVQLTGDGNSNLYVRGGSSDQNLFLLDDMPLYHVSHLGNITSTFNADIIKTADMYMGAFPAEFGGRLSSVVDVKTKDGDLHTHHQSVTLGLLTSKLMLEGPILKGKAAYVASFRINSMPLLKWLSGTDIDFNMYDMNLKANYIISSFDRLYFSFYLGNDAIGYGLQNNTTLNASIGTNWGNLATSLRYNKVFNPKVYANFTIGHSKYHYGEESDIQIKNDNEINDRFHSIYKSNISDNFLKARFDYKITHRARSVFGYDFYYHTYQPGQTSINQTGINLTPIDTIIGYQPGNSFDHSVYAELILDDIFGFSFKGGIRENIFQTADVVFSDLQPRIVLTRKLTNEFATKASFARIWQPFHLLSNSSAGVPADYRIPATAIAPPAKSNLLTVALNYIPQESSYEFSLEAYYKSMYDLADLKEGISFTTNTLGWESILATNGEGKSKGIELLIRKVRGNSTGWIGANLSNSTRHFDAINNGNEYPYKYDRLFDFTCFFQQQLTSKISFSTTWVFGTGLPYNIPRSQYQDIDGNYVLIYGEMNQFRQKSYHRLDINLNYKFKIKNINSLIDFSIINVYNRRNPYIYITQQSNTGIALYEFSLFPFTPSISVSLDF